MAYIDPYSAEGRAFLADYMADGSPIEDAIHDELFTCGICEGHFTDWTHDGDDQALDCWACKSCIGDERYSTITRSWSI